MQNMRDFLRGSLGRSLRELSEIDRLAAAWPVACGATLASHAEVAELDAERTLHIVVARQEWMQPFTHMRSALQNDLARIAAVRLSGIHFEVKQGSAKYINAPPRNPSRTKSGSSR